MVRGGGRFRGFGVEVAPGGSHGKKGSGAPVYARLDAAPAKPARPRAAARPRTAADRLDDPAARGRRRPAALEPLAGGSGRAWPRAGGGGRLPRLRPVWRLG